MFEMILKLWLVGTQGQPVRLKRQITLSNQIGFFGAIGSIPYQAFFLLFDTYPYLRPFTLNLLFITIYLLVLPINRAGHHNLARNLVLGNACFQILAGTYFISAEAGIHLFYLTLASVLSLIFYRSSNGRLLLLLSLIALLFLICHFLFPVGSVPVPVSNIWIDILFAGNALGAIFLSGALSYLFRMNIDRAEDRLLENNLVLERLSTTDQLTGLPNRRSLDQFLEQEWGRMMRDGQALSVLMCDVDCFKAYNVRYGHLAGDECLQKIAVALESTVRRPVDLVARYGGEEFAVVLPQTDEQGANHMGERIRLAVERLAIVHEFSNVSDVVTLSVGEYA